MNKEFEIEHFGFTAKQLSLERKHFLQKIIRSALDAMVNKLMVSEKTSELLLSAKEKVFEDIWASISDENERLNNLDIKYFTIPDHVLLPPYFDNVKSYSELDEQELDKHIEIFKNTFLENSTMMAQLKLENSEYKNLLSFIEDEVAIHEQLKDALNVEKIVMSDEKTNTLLSNFKN